MSDFLRSLRVPFNCPVCEGLMKGKSTSSWYDYQCCVECQIFFLEGRPNKISDWKGGWRPTAEEVARKQQAFRP